MVAKRMGDNKHSTKRRASVLSHEIETVEKNPRRRYLQPMARKLYPMPVEPIMRHPLAIHLPGAALGALMRLCFHFWDTELRPLPGDDYSLRQLARAHGPTWRHHRADVLQVFADIKPALERYHHERRTKATTIKLVASRGGGARAAQAAKRRLDAYHSPSEPTAFQQLGITPKREPSPDRPPAPDQRPRRPVRTDTLPKR